MRRSVVLAGSVALLALTAWTAASAWYLVSRDEVAAAVLESQTAQRRLYEDKIAALRTRLDEVSTQRMVEQEVLETRLQDLLSRQAAFEVRQGRVQTLENRIGLSTAEPRTGEAASPGAPPSPSSTGGPSVRFGPREAGGGPDRRSDLDRLRHGLDGAERTLIALEAAQRGALEAVLARAEAQSRRYEAAIRRVGLQPAAEASPPRGIGGPLVPAGAAVPVDSLLQAAEIGLVRFDGLSRHVSALPFAEPIRGEADLSSGFGHRVDPFTRTLAMHAGLDFRAEHGSPARAAGSGRVVVAEYSGAYGNMVEIEHAQGVTSRYAHLASIAVSVGQDVKPGTVLGRVGSTGRSTGPHLHYETRVNGDAVDPQIFLRAGSGLAPVVLASR